LSNKKLKHEAELLKEGIRIGMLYAQKRGTVKFEQTDSSKQKIEYVYRLLVHDKIIQPLAKGQDSQPNMGHKLALWVHKNLADDHPLK
jgi:predicted transcriptional regulator